MLAFKLGWFPNTGYTHFGDSPDPMGLPPDPALDLDRHAVVGFYSRVLRSNLLDMVNQDFVRTARAKGLPARQVFIRHVLRNSLMPIVTMFGLDFALLLGGAALVTEYRVQPARASASTRPRRSATSTCRRSSSAPSSPPSSWCCSARSVDIVYAMLDPRIRLTG